MAKKESTFGNMVIGLFVVSLMSSAALGIVYELTKEPIRLVDITRMNNAIRTVVPEFNNAPGDELFRVPSDGDSLTFYPAKKDGTLVGIAVETYTMKGFSGLIRLMVGFAPDGTILSVAVLEHKETPGLGDKIDKSKSDFSLQFEGKNPSTLRLAVKKDKGDIDAITASTITSRAYCDAIKRAHNSFLQANNINK